ncbi:MAG: EutN/CcmL family microcompartment protein [Phycisphaeraceae bacterium]
MRLARVIGNITLSRRDPALKSATLLIADALDAHALDRHGENAKRSAPMPESLVVYDELGAGVGEVIAVSEGREACMPFWPDRVPIDAYNAAILDSIEA